MSNLNFIGLFEIINLSWIYSAHVHVRDGKLIAYTEAIQTLSVRGATVEKVDQAQATISIFGGKIPQAVFPALANSCMKSELITHQKKKKYATGTGFMGVIA
ncbi:hypothetical protein M422DRAFT_253474 [Sphaerobolus stellatus SS14]|uniref:Uncharacterized protein n=1 Tax=Sphaerobolus stellatus (strain SS14) TaxID=990650 RepID=A0A0C9VXU1_SPHS4|nr:hypothetical protein M422DRAFT_253474 [Sphaerobolus stellatus SS14]